MAIAIDMRMHGNIAANERYLNQLINVSYLFSQVCYQSKYLPLVNQRDIYC